ncbi:hypothetical protein LDL59_00995 [Kaistella anthropi]|nr:hypothetical protein [Kaistella anthropi]
MKKNFVLISILISVAAAAQNINPDSLHHSIQEVVVIGTNRISAKDSKPLSSIDEYLQKSAKIEMIKRGAYA